MKRFLKYVTVSILIGYVFTACEKEYQVYDADLETISFNLDKASNGEDNMSYSFAFTPDRLVDTVDIPLQLSGFTASYDRQVNILVVSDSTTALEGDEYEIISAILPADSVNGVLKIKVCKSERIADMNVRVYFKIGASDDLVPGPISLRKLIFYITNQLTQPEGWPGQFGDYSKVKHQFCIDVLGIGSHYSGDWSLLTYYLNRLNQALYEYNSNHPGDPLRDENGVIVSFGG